MAQSASIGEIDAHGAAPQPLFCENETNNELLFGSANATATTKDGVDRFLVPSTSVAVRPLGNTYEAYVPNGLSILYALRTASGDTRAPGNR